MDTERFQYEKARVENEEGFGVPMEADRDYRRIDGQNFQHATGEYGAFEAELEAAKGCSRPSPATT